MPVTISLEEVEPAVLVEQELDGAGIGVADRPGDRRGGCGHRRAQRRRDRERRRLFDHFLVAALNRTFALDERQHRAVDVAEQLHFDMARARQLALEVHRGVAERRARFRSRRAHRAGQVGRVGDGAHALAAAAGDRLDQQRIADRGRRRRDRSIRHVRGEGILRAGDHRHAGALRRRPRRGPAAKSSFSARKP